MRQSSGYSRTCVSIRFMVIAGLFATLATVFVPADEVSRGISLVSIPTEEGQVRLYERS